MLIRLFMSDQQDSIESEDAIRCVSCGSLDHEVIYCDTNGIEQEAFHSLIECLSCGHRTANIVRFDMNSDMTMKFDVPLDFGRFVNGG